jgi:hypothetical protein
MKELSKAFVFCMIGMTLCFVPILYKNHWTVQMNGHPVKLFGVEE